MLLGHFSIFYFQDFLYSSFIASTEFCKYVSIQLDCSTFFVINRKQALIMKEKIDSNKLGLRVAGLAENKATHPSLAGALAELGFIPLSYLAF